MTRVFATLTALTVASFAAVQFSPPATGQTGAGWTQLFDGKSMDGWTTVGTANWRVEDGALVADKSTAPPNSKGGPGGGGHLVTKNSYKDHLIYAEFWSDKDANSGIFVRCKDPKKIGAKDCYEFNIFDERPDPSYGTGAIVYFAEANPQVKVAGKWNTMEITADKRNLVLSLNGTKTASVNSGFFEEGHFTLQWGSGVIKFRKVAVKPL